MLKKLKLLIIVGARPNFIKVAPLIEELNRLNRLKKLKKLNRLTHKLVHTGQYYDYEMSQIFFQDLKIPKPDYNLEIGSGSHAWQTAKLMERLEPVILKEKPTLIIVVGDVNSTLAGALVAGKLRIPVAHIEAGPRSFDMLMPEEINRRLTDHLSKFLFSPTKTAVKNLKKESIKKGVYNVGDIMYDVFLKGVEIARKKSNILERFKLKPNKYYLATIHRAENTDNKKRLGKIVSTFCKIKNLIFPCHPRTKKYLKQYKLWQKLNRKVKIIDPVGYLDMLWLEQNAKKILTDSGGIQKEAYWSKVPCITLMENTGWPETVKDGWNILVDVNPKKILRAAKKFFPRREQHKYFGDGKTAKRIIEILIKQRMK